MQFAINKYVFTYFILEYLKIDSTKSIKKISIFENSVRCYFVKILKDKDFFMQDFK